MFSIYQYQSSIHDDQKSIHLLLSMMLKEHRPMETESVEYVVLAMVCGLERVVALILNHYSSSGGGGGGSSSSFVQMLESELQRTDEMTRRLALSNVTRSDIMLSSFLALIPDNNSMSSWSKSLSKLHELIIVQMFEEIIKNGNLKSFNKMKLFLEIRLEVVGGVKKEVNKVNKEDEGDGGDEVDGVDEGDGGDGVDEGDGGDEGDGVDGVDGNKQSASILSERMIIHLIIISIRSGKFIGKLMMYRRLFELWKETRKKNKQTYQS